jgi:biopolymer transport protein ExbB/TolQ
MSTALTTQSTTPRAIPDASKGGKSSIVFHLILAGAMTALVNFGLQSSPSLMKTWGRYFLGHPIDSVETFFFFIGLSIIVQKIFQLRAQQSQTRELVAQLEELPTTNQTLPQKIHACENLLRSMTLPQLRGMLAERLRKAVEYVRVRQDSEGLISYLQEHAGLEFDRVQRSYGLYNTVVWAIPILGFLGTVVGITMAIANVTPEKLSSSLNDVTSGLAVAFDTTAQALGLSLILVFTKLLVSSMEEKHLVEVEQFCIERLGHYFVEEKEKSYGIASIQQQTSQEMFEASRQLIDEHVHSWSSATHDMREQWSSLLKMQSESMAEGFQQGIAESLASHMQELVQSRNEFTQLVSGLFEDSARRVQSQETQLSDHQEYLMQQYQTFSQNMANQLGTQMQTWQTQSGKMQEELSTMTKALVTTSQFLHQLKVQEQELLTLENKLNMNLQLLQNSDTFEQSLQTLNAAVHLLSARTRNVA